MDRSQLQSPAVSIVIPTFNRKDLLAEAVASCLGQTFADLEVVIVDDGSTDGTGEMVANRRASDWSGARVRYTRQLKQGASAARNRGMRVATGDFVQFLDSDDLLEPTKIERQLEMLSRPENRGASCCACFGSKVPVEHARNRGEGMKIGFQSDEPSELLRELCSRRVHRLQTAAPLWRQDFLASRSGWREDIAVGDDLEYYARLLADARAVCFVGEALFVVREHGGNRLGTGDASPQAVSSLVETRRSVFESARRAGVWDVPTQGEFLSAMRTIYANALTTADVNIIREVERWMCEFAASPRRRPGVWLMIGTRRLLGRRVLLGTHWLVRRVRAA